MNYYAFMVMVRGNKRYGGCVRAHNMDDAAAKAVKICKLSLSEPEHRNEVPRLLLEGEAAHLAIWVAPETLKRDSA